MTARSQQKVGDLHRDWSDDDLVVRHPTRRDQKISRFGDDVWVMDSLLERANAGVTDLHFEGLPDARRLLAKELSATRLNFPCVSSRRDRVVRRYSPLTVGAALNALKAIFRFMDERGIVEVGDLSQNDLDDYLKTLDGRFKNAMSVVSMLQPFVWLWESRDALTGGGMRFDPWGGRSTMEVVGYARPDENATERVPAPVMSALLRWALAYVDHFSKDIIAAERAYSTDDAPETVFGASRERFVAYVGARRRAGRGLPGTVHIGEAKACRSLIAKEAAIDMGWFSSPTGAVALQEAADELGFEMACLGSPGVVLEGQVAPWREPMTIEDMKGECGNLVLAAYVVVAYLSGMRDGEVQDLRRGCVEVDRDEWGAVVRHRLRGRTFKGERVPVGRAWIVIEPVARAVAVLERLTGPQSAKDEDDHLFVRLYRTSKAGSGFKSHINARLRAWMAHCNAVLAPRLADAPDAPGRLAAIPDGPDGEPWHLTTSQFRRTLAWFIANQPFGEIAGMIQYGHASVQMFEGYAGSPESGFREEVVDADLAARLDDLVDMAREAQQGMEPAGPMADELGALFGAAFGDGWRMPDFPGQVVGEQRLRELARSKAATVRLGALAHCFFVPGRAVCLDHLAPDQRREPVTGLCDPDCSNACWTKDHLPTWQAVLDDAEALLKINRLSTPQREELQGRRRQARAKVKAIVEARRGRLK